jgi:hypothetical protein
MAFTRRRLAFGVVGALYLSGAGLLAGLTVERIRADRERVAIVRAHERRQREARERAIRAELEQEAHRTASRPR